MFILQKKNKILILLLFVLSSCYFFLPIEPIEKVDDQFLLEYGGEVRRAKRKHYKSLAEANYNGEVSFEKTAYGKLLKAEKDFIEQNTKNNPFIKINTSNYDKIGTMPQYLTYNAGPYKIVKNNIFNDIKIPNNDFKHYNLGKKDFNEINNIELQEAYNYIYVINQEIVRQIEIAKLRAEAMKTTQKQDNNNESTSIVNKTRENLKNLTDRLKGLIN